MPRALLMQYCRRNIDGKRNSVGAESENPIQENGSNPFLLYLENFILTAVHKHLFYRFEAGEAACY